MKKLEELGISPAPWKVKQDSGYDRESGDFNTYDTVCDAEGKVMLEWANGESYGEVWPNSEQDANLIAAVPKLYAKAYEIAENLRIHLAIPTQSITMNRMEVEAMAKELEDVLAEAAGENKARGEEVNASVKQPFVMRNRVRAKGGTKMGNKRHSSHEMRQIADRFRRPSDNPYCLMVCRPAKCGFVYSASNEQKIEEMLLQAADLEEELNRSIADTHAALVERDALKAQIAESNAKWASLMELQKRRTETVQNELNQANARLSAVIKECDYQIIDYHPKSSLARCLKEFDDALFGKIKAIAKGDRK